MFPLGRSFSFLWLIYPKTVLFITPPTGSILFLTFRFSFALFLPSPCSLSCILFFSNLFSLNVHLSPLLPFIFLLHAYSHVVPFKLISFISSFHLILSLLPTPSLSFSFLSFSLFSSPLQSLSWIPVLLLLHKEDIISLRGSWSSCLQRNSWCAYDLVLLRVLWCAIIPYFGSSWWRSFVWMRW